MGKFLIYDMRKEMMVCRCCGESLPLLKPGAKVSLDTAVEIMEVFARIHKEKGCTQEKYESNLKREAVLNMECPKVDDDGREEI